MLIGMGTAAVVTKRLTTEWVGNAAAETNESIRAGEAVPRVRLEGGESQQYIQGKSQKPC